ncbi:MAG: hypothetical protein QOE97_1274 [Pseudonocardiales bacterium]|nr:hypothetical protein [Pseudonocardiales bacterium]
MPKSVTQAEALDAVALAAAREPVHAVWIGIDGPGGAGKSRLAARIAASIERTVVVHVDDFWGPSIPEWDWARFGEQVVEPLRAGRRARYQEWDWELDAGGPWHVIAPGSLVVVEGVSATRCELDVPWALRIWVETPADIRLARALDRDGPALMHRWFDDWIPSEKRYIAQQQPQSRADLIVEGTEPL